MRKLLYILIFLFLSFSFDADSPPPPGGWYQQWLPSLGSGQISDIYFIDSLLGYVTTSNGTANDTNYILKTTNGGNNWNVSFKDESDFEKTYCMAQLALSSDLQLPIGGNRPEWGYVPRCQF